MAIIMFGTTQQAQQEKGQDKSATYEYEEFIKRAVGPLNLRGQYIVDGSGLRTEAKAFLSKMLKDERPLTPCIRYNEENEAFVSPLTRGRHTGWAIGNAFISVNTVVGLISPGLQLPEYRVARVCPRPTGQVNDEMMWIVGPWGPRTELRLYVTDTDGNIEPLEHWIERKIKALQPTD